MKRYCIVRPEEWRKRYENETDTHFKPDGFNQSDGIGGDIVLTTDDAETPDKQQCYLITIEPITGQSGYSSDWGKAFLEERKKADAAKAAVNLGITTGRKFRS